MKISTVIAAGCLSLVLGAWTSAGAVQQTPAQTPSTGTGQVGSGNGVNTDPATQGTTDRAGQTPRPAGTSGTSGTPSGSVGTPDRNDGTRKTPQGTTGAAEGTGATTAKSGDDNGSRATSDKSQEKSRKAHPRRKAGRSGTQEKRGASTPQR